MVKSYDLSNVISSITSVVFSGFGETDAIKFEWASDIVATKKTADGDVIYYRLNDRECIVTVTLSQKSRAIPLLMGLIELQHGDNTGIHPAVIPAMPFSLFDPATGDQIFSSVCVLMNRPAPAKGKEPGEVEFKLSLPNPKVNFGGLNVI